MKALFSMALVLFISFSAVGMSKISNTQNDNIITATFNGVTEDGMFQFTDETKNTILFYRMSDEIEVSLYDDELIGKKFKITWEEEEIDMYDEEGEETGNTQIVKNIVALEEVN